MVFGVIYKITNKINGKIYIGQTSRTLRRRFTEHSKQNSLLGKDIQEFGKENFTIEVIEECQNAEQLNEREIFWITHFGCKTPNGYNTQNGGNYFRLSPSTVHPIKDEKLTTIINDKSIIFRQIGAKIAYYRTLKQMTPAELAKRANISVNTLNKIEQGNCNNDFPISTLLNIAESLKINFSSLVTFSEEEKKVCWRICQKYMAEEMLESTDDCRKELKCIGLRIAYFRKLQNITQATLAEKLSINKKYLSHIESGSANKALSLPLLIRISKALNIELTLLTDVSDLNKNNSREFLKEVQKAFDEMKELNSEIDKMMEQMDNFKF